MKALRLFFLVFASIGIMSAHDNSSTVKFIENKGQFDSRVLYKCDLPGGALFAEKNCLTYAFYNAQIVGDLHMGKGRDATLKEQNNSTVAPSDRENMIPMHAFRVYPVGSNTSAVEGFHARHESYNYFTGNDPSKWASNVKAYEEILYKDIYRNTDLRFYENEGGLKYEFILAPGARVDQIKMRYEGVRNIYLENDELVIETTVNVIREQAPLIYQLIDGTMRRIRGKFKLDGNILSFDLNESYNRREPLVLDPKLIFSTYSGSTADNWGNTACFDDAGNMYSGGTVFADQYPTTTGAYQESFGGKVDIGIQKFNATGQALFCTFIGGDSTEAPYSLVVNRNNELVIFGTTSSDDFPTLSTSFDKNFNGGTTDYPAGLVYTLGSDLIVVKLSSTLNSLLGSTYFGGSGNDGVQFSGDDLVMNYGDELRGDVITDSLNNIYITASTYSVDFPVTTGPVFSGYKDAVVVKFNSDLSSRLWARYLGGAAEDAAYSIQLDSMLTVYVSGGTTSNDFYVTTGPSYLGQVDGFVSHISSDGVNIINSRYIGTTSYDQSYFVQLDNNANVILFGQTTGQYLVTSGVYSNPNAGQFIHSLSHDLTSTNYSTVIGSGAFRLNISPTAFLVNECGNIFLSGWGGRLNYFGNTVGMPVTSGAFRTVTDGSDFYIMVLRANADSLLYGTYFGALTSVYGADPLDHVDGGTSRFDKKGIIYEAVCAGCGRFAGGFDDFPTTPGAHSNINPSNRCNNASFKFDLASLEADFDVIPAVNCSEKYIDLINNSLGGRTYLWNFGDGSTSNAMNPGRHTYATAGTYTITLNLTDFTTCIGTDQHDTTITINDFPSINFSVRDTVVCRGDSVQLLATCNPTYDYKWTPSSTLNDDTLCNPYSNTAQTTLYTVAVTDTNDCTLTKTVRVTVGEVTPGINYTNDTDCSGKLGTIFQNESYPASFDWFFGDGTSELNTDNMVEHEYANAGTYSVILHVSSSGCSVYDTLDITLEEVFFPNLLTPNADGKNDLYEIKGMSDKWSFEVFNRWGESIYKNRDYDNTWSGESLSDGVYYYLITSPNKTRCKGWVQIIR